MNEISRKAAAKEAVKVLNRIHKADPTVLPALINMRVPCNSEVAMDPTVQVGIANGGGWEVGILGLINGFFGVDERSWGFIYAHFDDEKNLTHFTFGGE